MPARTRKHGPLCPCLLIAALLLPGPGRAEEAVRYLYRPFHLSLVSPVSIPWRGPLRITGLSLDLIYGRISALYGIQAGLVNHEDRDAAGVQLGAVANWVGGDVWGIQVAGGLNRAAGRCGGICLAGGINWHRGGGGGLQAGLLNGSGVTWYGERFVGFAGVQAGGILNLADILYGLQVNLFVNLANDAKGVQVALLGVNGVFDHFAGIQIGGANLNGFEAGFKLAGRPQPPSTVDPFSRLAAAAFHEPRLADPTIMTFRTYLPKKTQGFQVASILNWADVLQGGQFALLGANFVVSQLAGVQIVLLGANLAFFDASGVQIASLFNTARTLKGVQVGLVNVCRTLYGVQFGLVNVCRTLHGFQIGAINVAYKNRLPFMFGVNAGF